MHEPTYRNILRVEKEEAEISYELLHLTFSLILSYRINEVEVLVLWVFDDIVRGWKCILFWLILRIISNFVHIFIGIFSNIHLNSLYFNFNNLAVSHLT